MSCKCGDEVPAYTITFETETASELMDPCGNVVYVSKECHDAQILECQKELSAKDLEIAKLKRKLENAHMMDYVIALFAALFLFLWVFR